MPYPMLIDGTLASGPFVMDVINPATEERAGQTYVADNALADLAIEAAARAFPAWAALTLERRRAYFPRLAAALEREAEHVARLLTAEQGKPLSEARGEVAGLVWLLSRYGEYENPVEILQEDAAQSVELHRLPLGVVLGIVPWNFPLFMAGIKIGTALVNGNTVVIKPAPSTPLATLELGRIWRDLLPAGVLNILADDGSLGPHLTAHPLVRKISFTGSTQTGRKIMQTAAAGLKRVTLELGGNDAAIVLPQTPIEKIANSLFWGAFRNNGQVCVAIKRVYVHRDQHDALCAALVALAKQVVMGDGASEATQIGPLQNAVQFEKVQALVALAKSEGRVLCGGERREGKGYFLTPAIVTDLPADSALIQDEQFGPILPVVAYDDVMSVVAEVNANPLGLGNSVWGETDALCTDVALALNSGTVWINSHGVTDPAVPFGGARDSGIGAEHGADGRAAYTQIRVINRKKSF